MLPGYPRDYWGKQKTIQDYIQRVETELDVRMAELIHRLASRPAVDDISDADIVAEVNAVRRTRRR